MVSGPIKNDMSSKSRLASPEAGAEIAAPTAPLRLQAAKWPDLLAFAIFLGLLILLVLRGASAMDYNWQWTRMMPYIVRNVDGQLIPGLLLKGLRVTLEISFFAMLIALPLGLATALLNLSKRPVSVFIARLYIEVIRNTPILLQILTTKIPVLLLLLFLLPVLTPLSSNFLPLQALRSPQYHRFYYYYYRCCCCC
jgi:His/Glu/Gln/Arg/opine family amino acid ABC transporter permease subunit